jgi:hypothetical protein
MTSQNGNGSGSRRDESVPVTKNDRPANAQRYSYEESRRAHIEKWVLETCENTKSGGGFYKGSSSDLYSETYPNAGSTKEDVSGGSKKKLAPMIPGACSAFPNPFDKRPSLPTSFKEYVGGKIPDAGRSGAGQASSQARPFENVLPKLEDAGDGDPISGKI